MADWCVGTSTNIEVYDGNGFLVQVREEVLGQINPYRFYVNDASGHVLLKTDGDVVTHTLVVSGVVLGSSNSLDSAGDSFVNTYQGLTAGTLGAAPSAYNVQAGDTLRGIARTVWGDDKLWYLIADANGLSGDEALAVGTVLRVPARINTIHNDYQTFKPYNAASPAGRSPNCRRRPIRRSPRRWHFSKGRCSRSRRRSSSRTRSQTALPRNPR